MLEGRDNSGEYYGAHEPMWLIDNDGTVLARSLDRCNVCRGVG